MRRWNSQARRGLGAVGKRGRFYLEGAILFILISPPLPLAPLCLAFFALAASSSGPQAAPMVCLRATKASPPKPARVLVWSASRWALVSMSR